LWYGYFADFWHFGFKWISGFLAGILCYLLVWICIADQNIFFLIWTEIADQYGMNMMHTVEIVVVMDSPI
jgi:hypothetical protein